MFKPTYLCGDTHGDMKAVARAINKHGLRDCTIVHAGDFGYALDSKFYQTEVKYGKSLAHYNTMFKARNIDFYVVRGNHDNPMYFDGRFMLSNLKLVRDYTTLVLNGERWLLVGGAVSLDRMERNLKGWSGRDWWPCEGFKLNRMELMCLNNVDVVVTHTAPLVMQSFQLVGRQEFLHQEVKKGDDNLLADVTREGNLLQEMYDILEFNGSPLKNWYHGHFHKPVKDTYKHTRFRCMAIDEIDEHHPQ